MVKNRTDGSLSTKSLAIELFSFFYLFLSMSDAAYQRMEKEEIAKYYMAYIDTIFLCMALNNDLLLLLEQIFWLQLQSKTIVTKSFCHLFLLPSGGMVIDTPGMREFGMWDNDTGIQKALETGKIDSKTD